MQLFSPISIDLGEVELNREIKYSIEILSNKLEPMDEELQHMSFSHPKMDPNINEHRLESNINHLLFSSISKEKQILFSFTKCSSTEDEGKTFAKSPMAVAHVYNIPSDLSFSLKENWSMDETFRV